MNRYKIGVIALAMAFIVAAAPCTYADETIAQDAIDMNAEACEPEESKENADAEDTVVEEASDFEEYVSATSPDLSCQITIDKETGMLDSGEVFEETFGMSFSKAKQEGLGIAIENNGKFSVSTQTEDSITATPVFGVKRILIAGKTEKSYGEISGIYYDGETILQFATESDTEKAYEELVSDFGSENVILDEIVEANIAGQQTQSWGSGLMGLDRRKVETQQTGHVTVALMDSGINRNHVLFGGRVIKGYNLIDPESDSVEDEFGHGTMTSGIIAENTPLNVDLVMIKILNGEGKSSVVTEIQGYELIEKLRPEAVNLSYGGQTSVANAAKKDEIMKRIEDAGTVICASSGNNGTDLDKADVRHYPAESPHTIAVSSINKDETISSFSNYGKAVDFAAPGSMVECAGASGESKYVLRSGTSIACPYITACAAMLKLEDPSIGREEAIERMKTVCLDMGEPGKDVRFGWGMPRYGEGTIISDDVNDFSMKISTQPVYNGKAQTPKVITPLTEGKHFVCTYANNVNAGTGKVTVRGISGYKGTKTLTFRIKPKPAVPSVTLSKTSFLYTGKLQRPSLSVKINGKAVPYRKSFPSENAAIGAHCVKVTLTGNYAGTVTKSFTILPKKVQIKRIKAKKKKITVRWSKGQAGYELYIKKKGSKCGKVYYCSSTSKTIKGLSSKKRYVVKVRTYEEVKGKKYYSTWSKAWTIKVK